MTASLPSQVQSAFDRFITTEYTTIDAHGQPITWPVTPYYRPGDPCIDLTTGVGYPKKADDARANPQVSLLFSEPLGSGLERPPAVLVQGTAEVDDADLDANRARYERESLEKLPATGSMLPPKPVRRAFLWYFARLYVHVRPERVYVWPEGDLSGEPTLFDAHMEEVRSGHFEGPAAPHADLAERPPAWDARIEELGGRYPTAVLAFVGPDGFPLSARMPVRADRDAGLLRIEGEPAGVPLTQGIACVTAHAHAPDFTWQRNFQVRGDLLRDGDGWALRPRRLVGGFELPPSKVAALRVNARKVRRFRAVAKRRMAAMA